MVFLLLNLLLQKSSVFFKILTISTTTLQPQTYVLFIIVSLYASTVGTISKSLVTKDGIPKARLNLKKNRFVVRDGCLGWGYIKGDKIIKAIGTWSYNGSSLELQLLSEKTLMGDWCLLVFGWLMVEINVLNWQFFYSHQWLP